MSKLSYEETMVRVFNENVNDRHLRHDKLNSLLEKDILSSVWFKNQPPHIQELYAKYPPWGFYTFNNDTTVPIRHFGIMEKDGVYKLQAVVNDILVQEGIDPNLVHRVKHWSNAHIENIKKSTHPATLMEPMGFMVGEKI